jgi:hypothetical protein
MIAMREKIILFLISFLQNKFYACQRQAGNNFAASRETAVFAGMGH